MFRFFKTATNKLNKIGRAHSFFTEQNSGADDTLSYGNDENDEFYLRTTNN